MWSLVFFDWNDVVHHEFLSQGRAVNKEYYLEVICRLREAFRQKRTELWKNQSWILHHDNAPPHTILVDCAKQFIRNTKNYRKTNHGFCTHRCLLTKNKTVIMPQPPYSSDLPLADFFLFFPKPKTSMKEKRYVAIEEMKKIETDTVGNTKSAFQKCFEDGKKCWNRCILSEKGTR